MMIGERLPRGDPKVLNQESFQFLYRTRAQLKRSRGSSLMFADDPLKLVSSGRFARETNAIPSEGFRFVSDHQASYPIATMCRLPGVSPDPHQPAAALAAVKDKPFGRPQDGAVLDRRCARPPHHRAGRDGRMAPPGAEPKNASKLEDKMPSIQIS